MSEYMFGVSREKWTREASEIADRIAEKHGATLIEATVPGIGFQRWFTGPNYGPPFDGALASRVYADLRDAGVLDGDNRVADRYRMVRDR